MFTERSTIIFEKLLSFFTLKNAYEGVTNNFSAKAFIEKLSVMSLKNVDLTLYQNKMNFKVYIFGRTFCSLAI